MYVYLCNGSQTVRQFSLIGRRHRRGRLGAWCMIWQKNAYETGAPMQNRSITRNASRNPHGSRTYPPKNPLRKLRKRMTVFPQLFITNASHFLLVFVECDTLYLDFVP